MKIAKSDHNFNFIPFGFVPIEITVEGTEVTDDVAGRLMELYGAFVTIEDIPTKGEIPEVPDTSLEEKPKKKSKK